MEGSSRTVFCGGSNFILVFLSSASKLEITKQTNELSQSHFTRQVTQEDSTTVLY